MRSSLLTTMTAAAIAVAAALAPAAFANTPPHCNDSDLTSDGGQVGVGSACSDPDMNAPFTFRIVSQPAHGVAQAYNAPSPAGVGYRPDPGFVGTDSFTYVVSDGQADSNVATVRITVGPPRPPSCSANGESVAQPGAAYVVRLVCAPGADGLPITFVVDSAPAHGTYELQRFNDFTTDLVFRSDAGFAGGADGVTWHGVGPRGVVSAPVVWSFSIGAPPAAPVTTGAPVPETTTATPATTAPAASPTLPDPFAPLGVQVRAPAGKVVSLRAGRSSGGLFTVRCSAACSARVTGSLSAHGLRVALAAQRISLGPGASRTLRVRIPSSVRSKLGPRPTLRLHLVVSSAGRRATRDATLATRVR